MLIDTHTHLYLPEFDADRSGMISRALANGINQFYLPAIDSTHTTSMLALESSYPSCCFAMMGLHPCSVKENYLEELDHVTGMFEKRKFVAIGEIGLDFYWDKTFIEAQYFSFNTQMELAIKYNTPIVIHSRDATNECIAAVKPFADKGLKGIFHCFGGSLEQANKITEMGFMLGIGGVLTYKNSGLDKVIADIELKHIVLETDSPYLSPQPFRGKRNEISYLIYVAEKLALIKGISIQDIASITSENARKVFKSQNV